MQTYLQYGLPVLSINSGATNDLVYKNNLGLAISGKENELINAFQSNINNFKQNRKKISLNCQNIIRITLL